MAFYWVVYQKGSFPVKEPYRCPAAAEQRLNALMSARWPASLVPPDPPHEMRKMLDYSVEILPPTTS
jgi:hypothetical protein